MHRKRIGIIGTGYIGRGISQAIERQEDLKLNKVLTRRNLDHVTEYPYPDRATHSVDELIENSDLIIDCSGDVLYSTEVLDQVISVGLPIITMNTELQLVSGSYLAARGLITGAEGSHPGCLAVLHEKVSQLGFRPLVYGNTKGYLNMNPRREDMMDWSKKHGISLEVVTSFTDGTKVQQEQALVANGLGLDIAEQGLLGLAVEHLEDAVETLARTAKRVGSPISDYIQSQKLTQGVFIIAEHDPWEQPYLSNYDMGNGPYYSISNPIHMPHLEAMKTIYRIFSGGDVLINNSTDPSISVAAIAKHKLQPGDRIYKASGSFDFRGSSVRIADQPNHIPIGLLNCAVIRRHIDEGQILQFDDVEIPESTAWKAWNESMDRRSIPEVM